MEPAAEPDFYLSSTESHSFEEPRRCWRLKRLRYGDRDDLLLVSVEPVIIGQKYGLGGRDIDTVVLAPRHLGVSLFPISEWPVYVHVARVLVEAPNLDAALRLEDLQLIAWAELYETEEDARSARDRARR